MLVAVTKGQDTWIYPKDLEIPSIWALISGTKERPSYNTHALDDGHCNGCMSSEPRSFPLAFHAKYIWRKGYTLLTRSSLWRWRAFQMSSCCTSISSWSTRSPSSWSKLDSFFGREYRWNIGNASLEGIPTPWPEIWMLKLRRRCRVWYRGKPMNCLSRLWKEKAAITWRIDTRAMAMFSALLPFVVSRQK